jgi:hypothetical protein
LTPEKLYLILLVIKELARMNQQEANRRMEEEIQFFPWFVQNYFRKKSGDQYSSITLYEYAKEYRRFLNWLIQEGFSSAETLSEVTLAEFSALWPEDLEFYKAHLVKAPKILKESTKNAWRKASNPCLCAKMRRSNGESLRCARCSTI